MGKLRDWYVSRTGYPELFRKALYEYIPGGARFRYATGSMLAFAFVTMVITGLFLWMGYAPSSQTAWESVYYIQYEMNLGWLLRGIHHFMAMAMMVLLPLHLLQVVWDKAYRPPREFNFWTGMVAMLLILGLALTGYLLPWDQKGFWATQVATNLSALTPAVGDEVQEVAVGGKEYGHHTLTRFFALHAGVLPLLLIIVLAKHLYFFRRHGITPHKPDARPGEYFWPKQVLKDAIGCLVLLVIVLGFCVHWDIGGVISGTLPREHYGAELFAPADPAEPYSAARPEWYFLFLFQMLKSFTGTNQWNTEFMGAIVVPGVVVGLMFLMPIIGRVKVGHWFNVAFLLLLFVGAGYFTYRAVEDDLYARWYGEQEEEMIAAAESETAKEQLRKKFDASRGYLAAYEAAEHEAARVKELVYLRGGAPKEGAIALLQDDPLTQGPKLFAAHCASCHSHLPPEQFAKLSDEAKAAYSAPNLHNVGSREWIAGLLDPERITTAEYFGNTAHAEGDMVDFIASMFAGLDEEGQEQVQNIAVALSAQADLEYQQSGDEAVEAQGLIEAGIAAMGDNGCFDCHVLGDNGFAGSAPDLTGYMSHEWLTLMISNPEHERMYGWGGDPDNNDRMPVFHDPDNPQKSQLTAKEVDLLVRWLRREWVK